MAQEALRFHVNGTLEDGEPLPKPRDLSAIMADPDNLGAVAFLVDLPDVPARTVRVNVTLPEPTLRRITNSQASHSPRPRRISAGRNATRCLTASVPTPYYYNVIFR